MTDPLSPLEILRKLVSFPTVSRDSNLPLIDWLEGYLAGQGIACHRYWNAARDKAALLAHVGPMEPGGVVLSGHTDVVPVDGQDWSTDPFEVVEKNGRYYGRGCADMKGFDALAVWALVEARRRGVRRPLQLALSFDEELGCTGAPPMIDHLRTILPQASAVIVGEPSMMRAISGHKGGLGIETKITGFEVHSSLMHQGVSAVMEAARLIDWANRVNAASQAAEPTPLAAMFEPPWTTLHVGTIGGGTAENITAKDCRFLMGMRVVAGEEKADWDARYREKVAEVQARMQAVRPEARIELSETFNVTGLVPEEGGEAEALVRRITGDNSRGVVSYATEAGQFQERGYSAVICGPGDIDQAHKPDEFLSVAQFEAGQAFMRRLLEILAE